VPLPEQPATDVRVLVASITSIVTATVAILTAFWLPLTDTQQAAVTGLIGALAAGVPTILAWRWRR
jgi:hypothetical protein